LLLFHYMQNQVEVNLSTPTQKEGGRKNHQEKAIGKIPWAELSRVANSMATPVIHATSITPPEGREREKTPKKKKAIEKPNVKPKRAKRPKKGIGEIFRSELRSRAAKSMATALTHSVLTHQRREGEEKTQKKAI
jgi:hypothetical protein